MDVICLAFGRAARSRPPTADRAHTWKGETMATTAANTTSPALLTDEMLARFDERAPTYDRENRFFDEDFAELRASGYLTAVVPKSFGGGGIGIEDFAKLQRRLAYVAPATAVAVNMHIYWTGVAADLNRMGDHGC